MNRPTYFYGFSAQFNYKGFDLNASFTGVAKRLVKLQGIGRYSNNDNFTEYMKNAWTPENANSNLYPRLDSEKTSPNFNYNSDFWVENGAFIRLRNVELGYTLPQSLADKVKVGSVRFYVNALNPFVWHQLPNDDYDPEMSSAANNNTINYPMMKALNIGLNLKF